MPNSSRTDEFVREFTRCAQRLYAYIFTLMGHDSAADDVFQEASEIAWRKFAEYRSGTDFFRLDMPDSEIPRPELFRFEPPAADAVQRCLYRRGRCRHDGDVRLAERRNAGPGRLL